MGLSRKQVVLNPSLKVQSLPYRQNGQGRQDRLENKLLPTYRKVDRRISYMFPCVRRQCWLQANAADPNCPPWQGRSSYGEEYYDAKSYSRTTLQIPTTGETSSMYCWQCRICVRFETSFLATKKRLLLRLVPLLPSMSLYQVATQDKVLRRPPSFRLWLSQPRLQREPLKF